MIKIASWNVNSLRVRLNHVIDWLESEQPDILALQETKLKDPDFPIEALANCGYQPLIAGQKTYNGVALLSRHPIRDPMTELLEFHDDQRRVLGVRLGPLYILNLYVPNGSSPDSEKYRYKLDWLDALDITVSELLKREQFLCILGDFNIAPENRDVHDPAAWEGQVLVSPAERTALQNLFDQGLSDCFRQFVQPDQSFSWWDYRAGAFQKNHGVRIDLILASSALSQLCSSCDIDKSPRHLDQPSDHAPVLACFDLSLH